MRFKFTYVPANAPTVAPTDEYGKFIELARQHAEKFFSGIRATRKKRSDTIHTQLATNLKKSSDTFQPFRAFEEGYLAIGKDEGSIDMLLPRVTAYFSALTDGKPRPWGQKVCTVIFEKPGPDKVVIKVNYEGRASEVGTLYSGTERYALATNAEQPPRTLNPVYCRRGLEGQHYISYPHRGGETLFVRRYVIRGLNQSDAANIEAGKELVAPYDTAEAVDNELRSAEHRGKFLVEKKDTNLTIEEQILSHTRGWAKRFISTTVTHRPVYSTRGTEFRSVFGAVIVDLAKVPGDRIHDIHAPGAITRFRVTQGQLFQVPSQIEPSRRTQHDEALLAVRDMLRTRELLILGRVPLTSLALKDCGACVLGVRVADGEGAKERSQSVFAQQERLWGNAHPFKETDCPDYRVASHWVKYYRFLTPAAALLAREAVPVPLRDKTVLLHAYDFPDAKPVGFPRA